jgi:hypothetical protein
MPYLKSHQSDAVTPKQATVLLHIAMASANHDSIHPLTFGYLLENRSQRGTIALIEVVERLLDSWKVTEDRSDGHRPKRRVLGMKGHRYGHRKVADAKGGKSPDRRFGCCGCGHLEQTVVTYCTPIGTVWMLKKVTGAVESRRCAVESRRIGVGVEVTGDLRIPPS